MPACRAGCGAGGCLRRFLEASITSWLVSLASSPRVHVRAAHSKADSCCSGRQLLPLGPSVSRSCHKGLKNQPYTRAMLMGEELDVGDSRI